MPRIFLDYASITPLDPKVEAEMSRVQKKFWANPSSLHNEGEMAKNILEEARINIARFLHCRSNEVFFTSGGTESLNLAIAGVVKNFENGIPHIIVSSIEHPAVLEPIKNLIKEQKVEISFISPNEKGLINPESIKKELKANTVLIVVQHANNEIGTIQPVSKISKIVRNFRELRIKNHELSKKSSSPELHNSYPIIHNSFPFLLVDACQSVCFENVSLERLGADILVLDGIKMYGPRGVGVLVVKRDVKISPIIFGGGQERGLRSGTENVAGAVGLTKALAIASDMREKETKRLTTLRNYAVTKILKEIPNSFLNGDLKNRLPNNINICLASPKPLAKAGLPKIDSEFLVIKLDTLGFAVSAASACHTLSLENGSYVIESLGREDCGSSSLRITLGRATKKSDVDKFISTLKKIIK
ncbi:MAG: cysteine desulfurase family protein [Candidatus Paceibacterota bacterium]|jgi:cysteine desulfurase